MKHCTVFLSAGEPSGDFLGSQLMKALKVLLGEHVTFLGVGGPLMEEHGLSSLFSIEELSIMGLAEIIPHIRRIRKRIQETVTTIQTLKPDIVITIDSPGFNFRVGKALKKAGSQIPLVHYVAPSVWAWRPGRARKVAQFLDHLLVLFPFEPPYFLKEGLPTSFVGHPVVEVGIEHSEDVDFRKRHRINPTAPLLTLLPGSRRGEISQLLPIFQETVMKLHQKFPGLHVVIPALPHLVDQIQNQLTIPVTIVSTPLEKFAAYQASQVALVASGTVSLEVAAAGLPMVIAYKVNPLTYFLLRRLVKIPYACLVNILMNEEVVPERLQEDCTAEKLEKAVSELLSHQKNSMSQKMKEAVEKLTPPAPYQTPSECAAHQICTLMGVKT